MPWPPGSVAHHRVPLADGGADNASNIDPMTPEAHREHHREDAKRWGKRSNRRCDEDYKRYEEDMKEYRYRQENPSPHEWYDCEA